MGAPEAGPGCARPRVSPPPRRFADFPRLAGARTAARSLLSTPSMDAVHLRNAGEDLLAVSDWRATTAQRNAALPRNQAAFRLRTLAGGALDGRTLAQLYALAFQHSVATPRGDSAAVLRRRVEEAVDRGQLLLIVRPRGPVAILGP